MTLTLFPIHSNSKWIMMDSVVREYFLFVALYCSRFSFDNVKLVDLIDVDKYSSYLLSANNNSLRGRFDELYSILSFDDKNNDSQKRIDEMLIDFEQIISKKYKAQKILEVSEEQKNYELNDIESKNENRIKNIILKRYNSVFNSFDLNFKNIKRYNRQQIFTLVDYTVLLLESPGQYYIDTVIGNIYVWLMNKLISDFGIKFFKRSEKFSSDEDFREYLIQNQFDTFIGNQSVFGCKDYNDYRTHMDFINYSNCTFIPMSNAGIAMCGNRFGFLLDDVTVEIYSPTIDEIGDIKKDDETGKYFYKLLNDKPFEFEENEIKAYIHDARKIIKISINATICMNEIKDKKCVIILE